MVNFTSFHFQGGFVDHELANFPFYAEIERQLRMECQFSLTILKTLVLHRTRI